MDRGIHYGQPQHKMKISDVYPLVALELELELAGRPELDLQ
jgi:hypothetical protein